MAERPCLPGFDPITLSDEEKKAEKRRKHAAYMREYYARKGRKRDAEKDRAGARRWREKNLERAREAMRQWRAVNGEQERAKRDCKKEYQRKRELDPNFIKKAYEREKAKPGFEDKNHGYHLRKKYGITVDQYKVMHEVQQGRCAICNREEVEHSRVVGKPKRLGVDHDHKTGKLRQLLCRRCNSFIGIIEDDPSLLVKALAYLRRHGGAI